MRKLYSCLAVAVLLCTASVSAQNIVYFPDNVPNTGASNAFPFNTAPTGGYTTFCIYPAATLLAAGITPSMNLTDVAFSPFTTSSGPSPCVVPIAKNWIGNMVAAPTTTGWVSNLVAPTLMWDSTVDGTLTFPWVAGQWSSIPIRSGALFQWDGVSNIGIQISRGAGLTGAPSVYTAPTIAGTGTPYTRHGTTSFDPAPGTATTTTGTLGFRIRLTFDFGYRLDVLTSGGGVGDATLSITNPPVGQTEGYTLVTLDTSTPVGQGPLVGIVPDALTFSIFSTPAAPGNPLHWISGFPGLFPDSPLVLPAGTLSSLAGQTWRFVDISFGLGFTYLGRTNVVQVTW